MLASEDGSVLGFIAAHLSRRFDCDGELEWLTVTPERRRAGVATLLWRALAAWFERHRARRICVDVDPGNGAARAFYRRYGAEDLNRRRLVWPDITVAAR